MKNIFGLLILTFFVFGCTEESSDNPDQDIYTGKYPNAQNKEYVMPIAENNYWIYKTLRSPRDTVGISRSATKKVFRFANGQDVTDLIGNLKIYQDLKQKSYGYIVSDSGISVCASFSKVNPYFGIPITSADTVIYLGMKNRNSFKEQVTEIAIDISGLKFAKTIVKFHKTISIDGNIILDVIELTSIFGTDQTYSNGQRNTYLYKKGVGELQFEDVDIKNGFEVLYDKRVLIDYKLN